ncbi:alkylmercury lyase family protein [Kribbella sp. NPDC056951]|uniref:alkylmercury lyase family protein n=1 Tax=Kribbella sp. NPDC056951 TaxID=3345978 RepID=UPI00364177E1
MKLEVLHVPDCPNLAPMLDRLRAATDLPVSTRVIETEASGMAGSPTLLIDGIDPFAAEGDDIGSMSCRLYRDEAGRIVPAPSVEQLRAAVQNAVQNVLSAWRTRALPLDPTEKAVHQTILRTFASTGHPPHSTAGNTLQALHDADAIRLDASGQIALAYPFSATPTRYRVRIGEAVDVFAMCAIDALGIAPMLGADTHIDSTDATTGEAVTVITTDGVTRWDPQGTVVFVGADAGGGPSVDCCCDYLNFFATRRAADEWTAAHPNIPGTVLGQADAEALAGRLFGHLLDD